MPGFFNAFGRRWPFSALTSLLVLSVPAATVLVLHYPWTAAVVASWAGLVVAIGVIGPLAISPAIIVATGLAVVAAVGKFVYPLVEDATKATGIQLPADPELMDAGFLGLTLASLSVSGGAIVAGALTKRPLGRPHFQPLHMPGDLRAFLTLAISLPTVGLIMLRGLDDSLERNVYLPESHAGGLVAGLSAAAIVALVIGGYLLHTQHGVGRLLVLTNILLSTFFLMSTGSRKFAAIPVLLAVGYYVARQDWWSRVMLLVAGAATLLLVPLPLYWRSLESHGLVPYLQSIDEYAGTEFGIATAAKTVLISLPIIGSTAEQTLPREALGVAIDPRLGQAAGWYDIAPYMRLNPYTPMAGVGELLNHGTPYLVVFFLIVGVYLGLLDRHVRQLLTRGHQLLAFAHVGLMSLFLVYIIQYNLRSSTRLLYYSIALMLAYKAWMSLSRHRSIAMTQARQESRASP